jgi:hypothetical protein
MKMHMVCLCPPAPPPIWLCTARGLKTPAADRPYGLPGWRVSGPGPGIILDGVPDISGPRGQTVGVLGKKYKQTVWFVKKKINTLLI